MPLRNLVWLLVIPGLVGLGLVVGASAPAPDKDYQLVRQVVEVLAEVDANYVRELRMTSGETRRGHDQRRAAQARPALGCPTQTTPDAKR